MPSPNRDSFIALNFPIDSISESLDSFTLSAASNTDLLGNTYTAPILYQRLRHRFVFAEVTICADWRLEYDQAGLVIFARAPPGQSTPAAPSDHGAPPPYSFHMPSPKWVKVGLELKDGSPTASAVYGTPDDTDWSGSILSSQCGSPDLRVKLERIGYALWVYYEDRCLGWKKIREITCFFLGVEDKSVWVGVYVSRPANLLVTQHGREHGQGFDRHLRVEFENLEIY